MDKIVHSYSKDFRFDILIRTSGYFASHPYELEKRLIKLSGTSLTYNFTFFLENML